ncbi:hypothetical protein J6590_009011 [Homalodisca vitripennis]|nr:hypothetical protein J6590_009011 [Homalodisca vitripennis]
MSACKILQEPLCTNKLFYYSSDAYTLFRTTAELAVRARHTVAECWYNVPLCVNYLKYYQCDLVLYSAVLWYLLGHPARCITLRPAHL